MTHLRSPKVINTKNTIWRRARPVSNRGSHDIIHAVGVHFMYEELFVWKGLPVSVRKTRQAQARLNAVPYPALHLR